MNDILITAPLPDFLKQPLLATYACHDYHGAADKAGLLAAVGTKIVGLVQGGGSVAPVELLDRLPNLKIISVFGVGYDGVPVDYCRGRGIKVGHTPDVLTDDVADVALALTLTLSRQFHLANRYVQAGDWPRRPLPLSTSVTGKTAGILGLGRIGKAIARRLEACGMKVGYHGRAAQTVPYTYYPTLSGMADAVDFLIVACPGGPATKNMVNAEVLAALGAQGKIVNIARGSIIDEAAMIKALQAGTLGGAGLDVFANEPYVPAELLAMDNVVLFPHVGSATKETRKAMGDLTLANLAAYFAGKALVKLIPELQ
ncbi:MAG: 2-hydroxyacid dehydrogenase [Betaproteobacteria bacterium]|nr:2-hydroxyacid dehydrogenase [Betaproteobacteria bacterium]